MAGNTILVVDDEQRMRKLVRDFLTKQNFRVLEAADGEEAVDVFMDPPVLQSAYYYADGTWRGK